MAKDKAKPEATEAEGKEAAPPPPSRPGGSKAKILLAGTMVLLILPVVGYIGYVALSAPAKEENRVEAAQPLKFGKIYNLSPVIVNLAESRGTRYLKAQIGLEMAKPEIEEELKERTPQISDLLIDLLSSKSIPDLGDRQGRIKLKQEILERTNALLVTGKILNVYFVDFVIQ